MGMVCNLVKVDQKSILEIKSNELNLEDFLYPDGEEIKLMITLDKSWQIIHYVLTGTEWDASTTLGKAILGGTEYGDDVGYGPARLLEASDVIEISGELEKITLDDFIKLLKSRSYKNAEIYCFDYNNIDDEIEYSGNYFLELKKIYSEAARSGMGILIYVN